jgi:NAD(P)-dependent dehydrogenase (short-subunit alcohol dehydrogenase family)
MDSKSLFNFEGKVVCITGALGLIGCVVSKSFLDCGAKVVALETQEAIDNSNNEFIQKSNFHIVATDISNAVHLEQSINEIVKQYNKIDIWVNLAYPRTKDWGNKLEDVSLDSFNENCSTHMGGYFYSSKLVLEIMKKQKFGSLINCGSIYGVLGPNFEVYPDEMTMPVAYSAIKAGIINLSKYFATMVGEFGVRVNSISPGGVEDNQPEEFIKRYNQKVPLKRMAKSEEIAMPILFLASDASSYITGQNLMVDGGWSAW